MTSTLIQIENILGSMRPFIQMDGGDVEFVSYQEGIVALRLTGACATCALSLYTLKMGIETRLKEEIPEIREVLRVD
jgi:Fe-S cluster biogenesis protein NfuA